MRNTDRYTRSAKAFSVLAGAAVLATACGDNGDDDAGELTEDAEGLIEIDLQLQWLPQGQFAGYFAAVEQGFFEEEGLSVNIIESGGDIVPQDALANGEVDYAIAWVPKVLETLEAQDIELTNVAQTFQDSGTVLVAWADSDIEGVEDFEDQRIGSWGFGNEWEIFAAMAEYDLDSTTVEIITQDFSMNALLDDDVDAAQAMTYNEYAQLLQSENPETGELYTEDDFTVIEYEETGGAMLQDAIWADTDRLESDEEYADTTVAFLRAVTRGWVWTAENPEEAAQITMDAGSGWEEPHELWMVNETNALIWPSPEGFGMIDEAAWDETVEAALSATNEQGAQPITEEPADSAWTNEYIEQALADLEEEDLDLTGENWEPLDLSFDDEVEFD